MQLICRVEKFYFIAGIQSFLLNKYKKMDEKCSDYSMGKLSRVIE